MKQNLFIYNTKILEYCEGYETFNGSIKVLADYAGRELRAIVDVFRRV